MRIRVIVTGRQYHTAEAVPHELLLPDGCSVDAALQALQAHFADGKLPESCIVAVSGVHLGTVGNHRPQALRDGEELLVLAPVAGG